MEQGGESYLAWRESAAWLVVRGVTGGSEAGGVHWSRLEEEGNRPCRGEGKLTVATVGAAEERAAVLAVSWKGRSFWSRWKPLERVVSLLLLLGLRW